MDPETQAILSSTQIALAAVKRQRYFDTERGFQAQFYTALHGHLETAGVLIARRILEAEHQKSEHIHNMKQRPDVILHVPRLDTGNPARDGNVAVWQLKRNAAKEKALEDFEKIDDLIENLSYRVGVFINISSSQHHWEAYGGNHRKRLFAFSTRLVYGNVELGWSPNASRFLDPTESR